MEVQRALGMAVGRDNQRKVKERLAIMLGNMVEDSERVELCKESTNKNTYKNNKGDKQ